MTGTPSAVLIIVENLPVPLDRRVWQEARTLLEAGYRVSVICPKGRGFEQSRETCEELRSTVTRSGKLRARLATCSNTLGRLRRNSIWR